jgi:hypothetical protein
MYTKFVFLKFLVGGGCSPAALLPLGVPLTQCMRCYVADLCLDYLKGETFREMGRIGSMKYEVEKDDVTLNMSDSC